MPNKDDLLNLEEKRSFKKPLIYGAIAFLVFIIAILGFAIYNNSTSKQDNVVLPPQIENNAKQNNDNAMFKEVPIEESNNSDDTLADKLIKNEKKENNVQKTQTEVKTAKSEPVQSETKPKPDEKPVKTAVKAKPAVKKAAVKKTAQKVKYYVQVAALMKYKKPNKKFLQLIKKEGYSYRLYETYYVKDGKKIEVVKILIGPFDKNKVREELKKIKNTITQNAFVFKVK
jgi:DedD protein